MDSTVALQLLLKMVVYSTNDLSVQAGCKLRHELKANGLKFTRMFIGGLACSVRKFLQFIQKLKSWEPIIIS